MIWRVVVVAFIVGIVGLFFYGLGKDPRSVPSPLVGQPLAPFSGAAMDGKPFTNDSVKGKVAMITFWATWCTTCRADEPNVEALQRKFGADPEFLMVGIATQDSRKNVEKFLASGRRNYLNLLDENGRLGIDFGLTGVPETFLVDKEGKVVKKYMGNINHAEVEKLIADALQHGRQG